MVRFALTLGCVLTLCSAVSARDYYVSPSGNNQNPGIKERPFRTIQRVW